MNLFNLILNIEPLKLVENSPKKTSAFISGVLYRSRKRKSGLENHLAKNVKTVFTAEACRSSEIFCQLRNFQDEFASTNRFQHKRRVFSISHLAIQHKDKQSFYISQLENRNNLLFVYNETKLIEYRPHIVGRIKPVNNLRVVNDFNVLDNKTFLIFDLKLNDKIEVDSAPTKLFLIYGSSEILVI